MGDLWVVTRSPPEPQKSICPKLLVLISAQQQHPPPPINHRFALEEFDYRQARLSDRGAVRCVAKRSSERKRPVGKHVSCHGDASCYSVR